MKKYKPLDCHSAISCIWQMAHYFKWHLPLAPYTINQINKFQFQLGLTRHNLPGAQVLINHVPFPTLHSTTHKQKCNSTLIKNAPPLLLIVQHMTLICLLIPVRIWFLIGSNLWLLLILQLLTHFALRCASHVLSDWWLLSSHVLVLPPPPSSPHTGREAEWVRTLSIIARL